MSEPLYLLDANICIYLLEGDAPALRSRVERQAPGEVVTSAIAVGEVLIGAQRRNRIDKALLLFQTFPALPYDLTAARAYAALPFKRASFDRLIAAHALSLGLTLVTNDDRDFAAIDGLRTENWTR